MGDRVAGEGLPSVTRIGGNVMDQRVSQETVGGRPWPRFVLPGGLGAAFAAGGALAVIGSFVPWDLQSVGPGLYSLDRNGFQLGNHFGLSFDGFALSGLGVISMLIAVIARRKAVGIRLISAELGIGLGALAVAVEEIQRASQYARSASSPLLAIHLGYGLWIVVAGAIAVEAAAVCGWFWVTKRIVQLRRQSGVRNTVE